MEETPRAATHRLRSPTTPGRMLALAVSPSSLSHHRHGLLESSRAVDTPAAGDYPAEHGDLPLVCWILGSTSSAPCHVGSKGATFLALPHAAYGTVTGTPAPTPLYKRVFQTPSGTARQRPGRKPPPGVAARQRPCDTSTAGRIDRDAAGPRLRAAHADGGRAC